MVVLTAMLMVHLAFEARSTQPLGEEDAASLATEIYIYGYPLVTMEMTRRVMTNVTEPGNHHAPMGQFYHAQSYPDATFRDVTAPNADTLYSTAWLDLSREPYILSLPDLKDRYFLIPMLDGWTTVFANPGKRTTGSGAQQYAITGPGWNGTLPKGLNELHSPTNLVWILGRTYSSGTPEDYAAVHALQRQYHLIPLSAYGKPYTPLPGKVDPSIDMKTPVRDQVNRMDAGTFFKLLATLMKQNPPTAEDAPMVAKIATIGIVPGGDFVLEKLDPAISRGIRKGPEEGLARIKAHYKRAGREINGWTYSLKTGIYGTDYLQRAFIAYYGLGANRPEDAIYPETRVDAEGNPLTGAERYMVHFEKGEMPPVDGFWSLTMYDREMFFVPNPINRYTVSSRSELKANPDGSVDLLIQKDSPGKEGNWLPAPAGEFVLMLRLYWPKEAAIDGSWKIPAVRRVP